MSRDRSPGAWKRNRGWRGAVRRVGARALLAARAPTAPRRALPDFVVIGAQKAGTTSLYAGIVAHPDVGAAFRKEVHYFDTEHYPDLAWYRRHFPLRRAGLITGESSPYYLFHPAVPRRMHVTLPDVLLVVILRDPVARAVSEYHHARSWGFERRSIDVALDPAHQVELAPLDDHAWYDRADSPARRRAYLARGRYAEQLERWLEVFDRERLLVLDSAALDEGTAIPETYRFLGLRPHPVQRAPQRNVGDYEAPDDDLVELLSGYFATHDDALARLLGTRLDWMR